MNKVDIKVVTTRKKYLKLSFRPIFKREKKFRNGAIIIEKQKMQNKSQETNLNILDLSKVPMQDFHYNYIKNKYDDKAKCC